MERQEIFHDRGLNHVSAVPADHLDHDMSDCPVKALPADAVMQTLCFRV